MDTVERDVVQADGRDLKEAEEAFAKWRAERQRGARIPQALWEKACSLHPRHSLFQIVRSLHLDFVDLSKRVRGLAGRDGGKPSRSAEPAFVELPLSAARSGGTAEATVKLKQGRKVRIEIRLKAVAVESMVELLREIWKR